MRIHYAFLLIFWISGSAISQDEENISQMFNVAEDFLYLQPQQTRKITEHIIENSNNPSYVIKAYLLQARALYVNGEYNLAVKAILSAKQLAESEKDMEQQLEINLFSISLLHLFGLDLAAEKYLSFTEAALEHQMTDRYALYLKGGKLLLEAHQNLEDEDFTQALNNFSETKYCFETLSNSLLVNDLQGLIIETYSKGITVDSTEIYLRKMLNELEIKPNDFQKMMVLNYLGEINFLKEEYVHAIPFFQQALSLSDNLANRVYKYKIAENLATNYLALEDSENFHYYKNLGQNLSVELEGDEENAVNTIFNYVNNNHTGKLNVIKAHYQKWFITLCFILTAILLLWGLIRIRYQNKIRIYKGFISYFENHQKVKRKKEEAKKDASKGITISDKTEKGVLVKLEKFENSREYTKKEMSLAQLATQLGTNTKYLSEIINKNKNKNFNSYINELRINYIIDKLKSNPTYLQYKISYLAEESGFASHSSFATVFKTVTGISPTDFIELMKQRKSKPSIKKQYEVD